jgi:hypothetical protein
VNEDLHFHWLIWNDLSSSGEIDVVGGVTSRDDTFPATGDRITLEKRNGGYWTEIARVR